MASIQGKVVLITGATSGIGKAAALEIARRGATTVIVGRNDKKTEGVVAEIRQQSGNQDVQALLADLSLMDNVRVLASSFKERFERLDVLVNNAGAIYTQRRETAEGIEMSLALNHLSYFLLTNLLLDRLKASAPARIVNTASDVHRSATIDFDDLEFKQRSIGPAGSYLYSQSKLANMLFTHELARRLEGSGVTANAYHPGNVATGLWQDKGGVLGWLIDNIGPLFFRSPAQGAETLVYLGMSPDIEGVSGGYFADCKPKAPSAAAMNDADARRLWDISAEMTGLPV